MPQEVLYDTEAYVTTTTTLPTSADVLNGVAEAPVNISSDSTDANYLGGGGWKYSVPIMKSFTIPLSMHRFSGDAVQERLLTAAANGTRVYFWLLTALTGTPGTELGTRYECTVTSNETSGTPTDLKTVSLTLTGQGAPFTVTAAA